MSLSPPSPYSRRARNRPGYRWGISARVFAALPGGYALAGLVAAALVLLCDTPRDEAIAAAALPAFLVQIAAGIWAFWARTAARAWLGLGMPALLLSVFVWWLHASHPA